ncbi:MAG: DUF3320 domain-containing protein [Zoogloeaceae bacterium]|jgi:very-short-patch-repair endonuclease|nr:DUF3320 domain-containing protein [Zoogloeaceae bacterium]
MNHSSEPHNEAPFESAIRIEAALTPRLNLAFHQNAIPTLREVTLIHDGDAPLQALTLSLTSSPPFFKPKVWHVDTIGAKQQCHLAGLDVALDAALLNRLTEAEKAEAHFCLQSGEKEIARLDVPIELLARNQWGGIGDMPEMAAAFVQPNDPAIDRLLKKATQILREHDKNPMLNGYQEGSAKRAWELAAAIWGAIAALELDYTLPPASFEQFGQKIRSPGQIEESRLATCLDSTLLFCAALEQCGLNPLIVFTHGHAFAGVWLKAEEFSTPVIDDIAALRKRLQLREMVLFETTVITHRPCPTFSRAAELGAQQIAEGREGEFELAVDIRRARLQRIVPLASAKPLSPGGEEAPPAPQAAVPDFEEPPDLPDDIVLSAEPDNKPDTPQGRIDRWQRKLLDLSLRNNLLNFKAGKRSLRLDAPDPGKLEDLLADGHELKLLHRPDWMAGHDPRDPAIHAARHQEDLYRQHALEGLGRKQVFIGLEQAEMEARLVELYRSARLALQEGGANTLFLALGFLSWTQTGKDDKKLRAPLILIPVALKRKSVRSGFSLVLHEDEPRFNPTLLEMLRQDFRLTLPVADGELPKDEHGIDIPGIWRRVAQAIRDIPGWEVVEDVALSTFSFAKHLMWKDLVDRTARLKNNPVVRHLIDSPRDAYGHGKDLPFPEPRKLDAAYGPEQTFCPLPADSSQLSAVMAAAKGKDFVLIGPPGTGKSQTIANLIAQCLAEKKTVLFVAEKIAALDVVYRRLREVGLGEFCLELHSSKASKLAVLGQLGEAWSAKGAADAEQWQQEAKRLKTLRDQLNGFVDHLHRRHGNGLSAFQAIGRIVSGPELPRLGLSWPSVDAHDAATLNHLRELADRLDVDAKAVGHIANNPLAPIAQGEWSPGWQQALLQAAGEVPPAVAALAQSAEAFIDSAGFPPLPLDSPTRKGLAALAQLLPQAAGHDWRFVLSPNANAIRERLHQGGEWLRQYRAIHQALSVAYRREVLDLDARQLQADWNQAQQSWWPMSWLRRRTVASSLKKWVDAPDPPDIEADIERLVHLQKLAQKIERLHDLHAETGGLWRGLQSDAATIESVANFQAELQACLRGFVRRADTLVALKSTLGHLLGEGNALLEPGALVAARGEAFVGANARFQQALSQFAQQSGQSPEDILSWAQDAPPKLIDICQGIAAAKTRLRDWCAWRKARAEALLLGLGPLIEGMETGSVALGQVRAAFETDYCRWWLNALVDGDDILRNFVSAEQEKRIADFRTLDDHFTQLTRDFIRARLCAELPNQERVANHSEWGVLRHEMQKKKRHLPLRELMQRLPNAVPQLTPCLLMSPLSIAQYLPSDRAIFDVVVFDEASQIPVWDAIGAMARARQVVMVGDPKQMPPTNFFQKAESNADDGDVEEDLESILDECLGANLPTLDLHWHYRSRHESLIAFSNLRYYGGGLVTFPSPLTEDRAVSFQHVAEGVYERAGARTNPPEARALVADVLQRLQDPQFRASGLTIGIVTFNMEQQQLIEDLLDEARRQWPIIEACFAEDNLEPLFVKNLESVQGDERDIIYFSITYGPDRAGNVSMNFGPLNKDGGQRRLNVAITRARHAMRVFSSLKPEQLDLSRTKAEGVRDLKQFLEFAERGPRAFAEAVLSATGDYESPFEAAVASALMGKGWQVHPQVGVSQFRIDLGIVDPDAPGRYLAGVECDGATYHRSATARDRDKLREQVLRGLGWEIVRLWSTDWWIDADGTLEKVNAQLENLLAQSRARRAEEAQAPEVAEETTQEGDEDTPEASSLPAATPPVFANPVPATPTPVDAPAEAMPAANPDAFFEPHYDATLKEMMAQIVQGEAPIKDEALAERIARLHGWKRTGSRIKERVFALARPLFPTSTEEVGQFFWQPDADTTHCDVFRRPPRPDAIRPVDAIALPELMALAREAQAQGMPDEESALSWMKQAIGIHQIRSANRERLLRAWRGVLAEQEP